MEHDFPESIIDGSISGIACDQRHHFRADLELCAGMANNAHRFSVEWSRVEPEEGVFSASALRYYATLARTCRELGMEPVVTLHHFTLPRWLADSGGVCRAEAPRLFARFAGAVAEALGDDVSWWLTINEPSVYAVLGYMYGAFPPRQTSLPAAFEAFAGLLRMHAAATMALRQVAATRGMRWRISFAHHERRLRPASPTSLADRAATVVPEYLFNRWFLRSCRSGRMLPPVGHGQRIAGLLGSLDYLGVNFYCEDAVDFDPHQPTTMFARQHSVAGLPRDTFGNSLDSAALSRALSSLWNEFRLPILITENGVADEHDELRAQYLIDHLGAVLDALHQGVDVRGYLHWTQLDNFEWSRGYAQHFGLFAVDRDTMARHAKPSAALYGEICRTRRLPVTFAEVPNAG